MDSDPLGLRRGLMQLQMEKQLFHSRPLGNLFQTPAPMMTQPALSFAPTHSPAPMQRPQIPFDPTGINVGNIPDSFTSGDINALMKKLKTKGGVAVNQKLKIKPEPKPIQADEDDEPIVRRSQRPIYVGRSIALFDEHDRYIPPTKDANLSDSEFEDLSDSEDEQTKQTSNKSASSRAEQTEQTEQTLEQKEETVRTKLGTNQTNSQTKSETKLETVRTGQTKLTNLTNTTNSQIRLEQQIIEEIKQTAPFGQEFSKNQSRRLILLDKEGKIHRYETLSEFHKAHGSRINGAKLPTVGSLIRNKFGVIFATKK